MPTLNRRRDPDANQETWLGHYDDILVGSIGMRAGVPVDKDQWGWSVGFYPAADRGLRASGTAKTFDAARAAFDVAWQWLLPKFTEADFREYRRHRAMRARDVGCGPQTADAGGGRSVNVLLRRGDWNRGYGKPRLYRAHGERMKFIEPRPFADPESAARKLIELANAFEPVQDGRIYIEKINGPFLYELKGTPAEYKAGLDCAIAKGWLVLHESGTYSGSRTQARRCSPDELGASFRRSHRLPDGRALQTLRDAGHYVTALSKADQGKPHWQTAAHKLMMAAEGRGPVMFAHIAIMRAIRATKKRLCVDLVHEDEWELEARLRVLSHRQPLRAGPVERTLAT